MAPSETQNLTLSKIDSALTLWKDENFGDCSQMGEMKLSSHLQKMWDYYLEDLRYNCHKFAYRDEFISSGFPLHQLVAKPKLLEERQLYEAILFSKIFHNLSEFDANCHEYNEFVWIQGSDGLRVRLIYRNQIVYSICRSNLNRIRQFVQPVWDLLKKEVRNNLIEAFDIPESVRGQVLRGQNRAQMPSSAKLEEMSKRIQKLEEAIERHKSGKVTEPTSKVLPEKAAQECAGQDGEIAEWELDEEILQKLKIAVRFLGDHVRENYSISTNAQTNVGKSLFHVDLIQKICSYKCRKTSLEDKLSEDKLSLLLTNILHNELRSAVVQTSTFVHSEKNSSVFLNSKIRKIGVPQPQSPCSDSIIKLIVFYELVSVLRENVEYTLTDVVNCMADLEKRAETWKINLF